MTITIRQRLTFDIPPGRLYEFYMDAELHSKIIDGEVQVSEDAGSPFRAWSGSLQGTMLYCKTGSVLVQTWRGDNWDESEQDSVLMLVFHETDAGTELEMIHANIPDRHAQDIENGWHLYYWKPWSEYIQSLPGN